MRTTVELPDQLFRLVKSKAAKEGLPLKALFTRAIEREMESAKTAPKVRLQFPLIHRDVDPAALLPVLSKQQMGELLDAEEADRLHAIPRGR